MTASSAGHYFPERGKGPNEEYDHRSESHESRGVVGVVHELVHRAVISICPDHSRDGMHQRHEDEIEGRPLVQDLELLVRDAGEDGNEVTFGAEDTGRLVSLLEREQFRVFTIRKAEWPWRSTRSSSTMMLNRRTGASSSTD